MNKLYAILSVMILFLVSSVSAFDAEDGLRLYMKMDEDTGTTTVSEDGHFTGTLVNTPPWINTPILNGIGLGLFDVSDGHFTIDNLGDLPSGNENLSISIWWNATTVGGATQHNLLLYGDGSEAGATEISIINTNSGAVYFMATTGASNDVHTTSFPSANKWYNVIVTFNGNTDILNMYLNGVINGTGSVNLNIQLSKFEIGGANAPWLNWDGYVDNLRVYNSDGTYFRGINFYNS